MITAWGQPAEIRTRPTTAKYSSMRKSPFQAVEVLIGKSGLVSTIKITLAAPIEPKQLAEQLSLDQVEPVTVSDERTSRWAWRFQSVACCLCTLSRRRSRCRPRQRRRRIGQVNGVARGHSAARLAGLYACGPRIACTARINKMFGDLKTAHRAGAGVGPGAVPAGRRFIWRQVRPIRPNRPRRRACDMEPKNAAYQVCRSRCRDAAGRVRRFGASKVRSVLDRDDLPPLVRAQALYRMAHLASLGDVQIAGEDDHRSTRRQLKSPTSWPRAKTSRSGMRPRNCSSKPTWPLPRRSLARRSTRRWIALSLWVGRASGLAEDYIANDGGSVELRLSLRNEYSPALASFRPTLEPGPVDRGS